MFDLTVACCAFNLIYSKWFAISHKQGIALSLGMIAQQSVNILEGLTCRDIALGGSPLVVWSPLNSPLNGGTLASSSHNTIIHLATSTCWLAPWPAGHGAPEMRRAPFVARGEPPSEIPLSKYQ